MPWTDEEIVRLFQYISTHSNEKEIDFSKVEKYVTTRSANGSERKYLSMTRSKPYNKVIAEVKAMANNVKDLVNLEWTQAEQDKLSLLMHQKENYTLEKAKM